MHRSEQGSEAIERILFLGAVAIPAVGFLMMFREELTRFLTAGWEQVADSEQPATSAGLKAR